MNLAPHNFVKKVVFLAAISTQALAGPVGPPADLSITKTDGLTQSPAGAQITYTITVSNAGPEDVVGASVSDVFPPEISEVNWTCSAQAGSACSASGMGDIDDLADILSVGQVTYTATATPSFSFSGMLSNTATVAQPAGITDPNPANNGATDETFIDVRPVPTMSQFGIAALALMLLGLGMLRRRRQ